eukprot:675256-Rhodomonas_salina.1
MCSAEEQPGGVVCGAGERARCCDMWSRRVARTVWCVARASVMRGARDCVLCERVWHARCESDVWRLPVWCVTRPSVMCARSERPRTLPTWMDGIMLAALFPKR